MLLVWSSLPNSILCCIFVLITFAGCNSLVQATDIADSFLMCLLALVKVPFSKVVYIEQSDFRTKDSKDYYGLAPGKSVLLRC